ncbi:transposase [Burkholderia sp. WSM2230]|uniref:transposase n=1 Tax=Burkholderia sp. WSM2230 TaxID=944435 RepID=UPI000552A29F|nr:transposase [Burkholderia sp. WSM2230]
MSAQKTLNSMDSHVTQLLGLAHTHSNQPMPQIPLSDADWARVQGLFPEHACTRGRPRRSDREILNAILWLQQRNEKWHRLPGTFPPQQTCYLRYMTWKKSGVLDQVNERLPQCNGEYATAAGCNS